MNIPERCVGCTEIAKIEQDVPNFVSIVAVETGSQIVQSGQRFPNIGPEFPPAFIGLKDGRTLSPQMIGQYWRKASVEAERGEQQVMAQADGCPGQVRGKFVIDNRHLISSVCGKFLLQQHPQQTSTGN